MGRVLRRRPGVLEQELDGELLLLAPGSADVVHLNEVASAFWQELSGESDADRLAERLGADLGVLPARLLADLGPVIDLLVDGGLLEDGPAR